MQDKLYDLGSDERELEYGKQRIHMGLPRPTDVNEVQNWGQDGKGPVNQDQNGVPRDVGAAGFKLDIICFKCGHIGHPASRCPSQRLGK
eukprot:2230439-Karenia_brevis.AAC.1